MGEKNKEQISMVRDLTSGSVTKQILIFAMPLFVANALQAIYNLVDMVVVGQVIGGTGMSAVSIGGDVLHLLTFLAMGFASAGQVIISQYVGARNDRYDVYFFICNFDYHVNKLLFTQISDSEYSEYTFRILYIYDGLHGYLYFWTDFYLRI